MNISLSSAVGAGEIIPARSLNFLYIYLDIAFLLVFIGLLIFKKEYRTLIFALVGGVLYFIVDYGIFYAALGSRTVTGADTFWFLLWLSMSYGITNFAWIWLCLKRDIHLKEWLFLIIAWWIVCPLISQNFGGESTIYIQRTTSAYHGVMGIMLIVGYLGVIAYNFLNKSGNRVSVLWLNLIGISVQFSWELALLIGGIRSEGYMPLIVDSLVETNMGMPYIYGIYLITEKLFPRKKIDNLAIIQAS